MVRVSLSLDADDHKLISARDRHFRCTVAWPNASAGSQGHLESAGRCHCQFAEIQELHPSGQQRPTHDQLHPRRTVNTTGMWEEVRDAALFHTLRKFLLCLSTMTWFRRAYLSILCPPAPVNTAVTRCGFLRRYSVRWAIIDCS